MPSPLKIVSCVATVVALLVAPSMARAQVEAADASTAAPLVEEAQAAAHPLTVDDRVVTAAARGTHDVLFNSVSAALITAASTDLSVSMYQIGRGTAREAAFGAPWQDSPVAFAVTKSAMAAAFVFGLQRMHKTRPKTALVLGIAATAFEGWLTVRSAQMPVR